MEHVEIQSAAAIVPARSVHENGDEPGRDPTQISSTIPQSKGQLSPRPHSTNLVTQQKQHPPRPSSTHSDHPLREPNRGLSASAPIEIEHQREENGGILLANGLQRVIESYKGVVPDNGGGGWTLIVSPPASPPTPVVLTPLENTLHCLLSMKGQLDIWSIIKAMHQHTETPYQSTSELPFAFCFSPLGQVDQSLIVYSTDFLCQEMRRFDFKEIEFYLPQLCHLLLHRFNITALQM